MAQVGEVCIAWGSLRGCQYGASCKYKHEGEAGAVARSRARANPQPCRGWASERGCTIRDCPYLHEGEGKVAPPRAAAPPARYTQGPPAPRYTPGPAAYGEAPRAPVAPCRNFSTPDGCKFGAACRFVHPGVHTAAFKKRTRPSSVCRFFSKPEGCKMGAECKYKHIAVPAGAAPAQ
jgi:hypothetical protein